MEIRSGSLNFRKTKDEGPQKASLQFSFPRRVRRVAAGISGYSASFEEGDDHEFGRLTVELNASRNDDEETRVDLSGTFGLRDWSGQWDDPYSGLIHFVLLAELDAVEPPLPGESRGDLIVLDAEVTQVIQHFRSWKHLDTANVFPDNSIRLIAEKPTAVRLYVDYDSLSGLPPVESLSGLLSVTSGGAVTELAPLETIAPHRDSVTERGRRDHTLNFLIPEGLCTGDVDIVARVFDEADPTQVSANFSKSLSFDVQPQLPILAVAIDYTGPDVSDENAVAAPVMADFLPLFRLTEALFPIPSVVITSLLTMTYDEEVDSDISQGCDKLSALRDAVADMRGDSDDIVYGLLNSGVETGSVGGCGGSGTGVGRIGEEETAAHEIGHALGRGHVACDNVTRCAEPKNTDDGYPVYSGYDSDSIGEFGFDTRPARGRIKDPANAHDIMGYSGNSWISPYTYKALMSRIPERFGEAAGAFFSLASGAGRTGRGRGCWIPVKQPKLFLRIDIHRDRSVDFHCAFHFPARPRPHGAHGTDFLIELHDSKGKVLIQERLFSDTSCCGGCGCGCGCAGSWPLRVRQAIAFHPSACSLVLFDCEKEIARRSIAAPPEVRLEVRGHSDRQLDDLDLSWEVTMPAGTEERELWYLVQWRDRAGTWRGAAPRGRETRLTVPKRIFAGQRQSAIRVLASGGIATGAAEWEGAILQAGGNRPPQVEIGLIGIGAPGPGGTMIGSVLQAVLRTQSGAAAADSGLRWYDESGGERGRGRSFDLAGLPLGPNRVTARALDAGFGGGTATWLIDHRADGSFILLEQPPEPVDDGSSGPPPSTNPEE